ncbi:MAG: DNA alkylation repair protein, partial [Flavobacteriales bacterium]|nr:DNA alkylation repair protein [Flavobacteriales bacterium]
MNATELMALLAANKNQRGIDNWEKSGPHELESYGMGLTLIKKLAKESRTKDQSVANELWNSNVLEAKHLACLVGEPKTLSQEDLTEKMKEADNWMVAHTFIQNVLSKSPHRQELSDKWRTSKDNALRSAGYQILYYMVKDKKLADSYFLDIIPTIEKELQQEANFVK